MLTANREDAMADELTIRASISFTKGSKSASLSLGPSTFDVAGNAALHNVQEVGFAAEEALLMGDVAAGGYCLMVNRDDTNFVEVRPNTGVADLIRLEPGDVCLFRITDDAVPYLLADTAAVDVEVLLIDA
jgi:hypothetical protein